MQNKDRYNEAFPKLKFWDTKLCLSRYLGLRSVLPDPRFAFWEKLSLLGVYPIRGMVFGGVVCEIYCSTVSSHYNSFTDNTLSHSLPSPPHIWHTTKETAGRAHHPALFPGRSDIPGSGQGHSGYLGNTGALSPKQAGTVLR
jgi:hypothetical protein